MDSQTTLVNSSSPSIDLVFEKTSLVALRNTVYLNSRPLYTITTSDRDGAKTKIFDASTSTLLVTIERRAFFSDRIIFTNRYDGKSLKVNNWIKELNVSGQHPMHVIETPFGNFIWKVHVLHRHALFSEFDAEIPIAYMRPPTRSSPMGLHLERGTENFREEILGSFLILEQRMKMKEKVSAVGDGIAMQASMPFGGT
ncbi:hypothetical protein BDQ12DRAFT_737932 [Crucibulum laeve]|uniref:DUF6593 domain-containing protein n=1 Tax=Crucibulum laeve TaxID=68775 RepID=A0A5C3LSJ7_9AGAR|nr:hypothetical protein BDQ12DRAFT_737932 [Crucibulum laeve]